MNCPKCGTWDIQKTCKGILELGYDDDNNLRIYHARPLEGSNISCQCNRCYHEWEIPWENGLIQEYYAAFFCCTCGERIIDEINMHRHGGHCFCSSQCKRQWKELPDGIKSEHKCEYR